MKKDTIELRRCDNHPAGYGRMDIFADDSFEVLDALTEWSQKPENAGLKVYRHRVRSAEEKNGELGEYDFTVGGWNKAFKPGHGILRTHFVEYLDIWAQ